MDDVRLLRIAEVAELLRISRTKVYQLIATGEIPSLHVGRSRRVPLRALADWIEEQTTRLVPASPPPAVVRAMPRSPRSTASTSRAQRPPRPRSSTAARAKPAVADWPFFKPWMPHPMDKDEYERWVRSPRRASGREGARHRGHGARRPVAPIAARSRRALQVKNSPLKSTPLVITRPLRDTRPVGGLRPPEYPRRRRCLTAERLRGRTCVPASVESRRVGGLGHSHSPPAGRCGQL